MPGGAIWTWLTSDPVVIWGSLITGCITLLGVVIAQFAIYCREEKKEEEETEALRQALAVELRAMDSWLEDLLYSAHDMEKFTERNYALSKDQYKESFNSDLQAQLLIFMNVVGTVPVSNEVYESNADKIGRLEPSTAKSIIRTHRKINQLNQTLQSLREELSAEELAVGEEIDWSTGEGLSIAAYLQKEQIKPESVNAVINQKATLLLLGQEVTERDSAAFVFAFGKQSPESQEEERLQQTLERYMEKHDLSIQQLVKGDHPLAQEKS